MTKMPQKQLTKIPLLLLVGFIAGPSLLRAQNLVTNGGFESGLTEGGWSHNRSGIAQATYSLETNQPYGGVNALKVATTAIDPAADWRVQSLGPTFTNLGTGRATSIRLRARAETAGTRVRFVMAGTTTGSTTQTSQTFTLSTSWAYYHWDHTTTSLSPQLRIQHPGVGTVWLDDISMVTHDGTGIGISINPSDRRQVMDGIGGSIAFNLGDYEALSSTQKNEIENLLYVDCGVDIVRLRTGNSDTLNNELAMRAQRNGARSLLTCWSPPASLKSNNSIVSGTLRIVSGNYDYAGFADWWYQRLVASNWAHDFVSIQNEPSFDPGNKETCRFFANETVPATADGNASYKKALEALYDRIKNEPERPQLMAVDTETHSAFKPIADTVSSLTYVNHLAFHNYGVNDFAGVKAKYNGKRGWMTEWGKDASETDPIGIKEDWKLLAKNIHDTLVNADASAYLAWRMVHGNNTGQVWAMIGVENRQYVVQNPFYVVKHYAKEISFGDQRFGVTRAGTNTAVSISGYINPKGKKITLVALNTGTAAADVSLRLNGLPVSSATGFRTLQSTVSPLGFFRNPYASLGVINTAQNQTLPAESMTTYVVNLSETLNPYDPSLLRVDNIKHEGNQISLTIPAQPGHDFILWKSTTLAEGSWLEVTDAIRTEQNGELILTDPNPESPRVFYRVQRDTTP
jgi:glucuronoarabinoxylan endo-1,4-beta-xylanase